MVLAEIIHFEFTTVLSPLNFKEIKYLHDKQGDVF